MPELQHGAAVTTLPNADAKAMLSALLAGTKDSFRLHIGDTTVEVSDDLDGALAVARGAPIYLEPITTGKQTALLYTFAANARRDQWHDDSLAPTAVLIKDDGLICVYALETAVEVTDAVVPLAARMGGFLDEALPMPGTTGWELIHLDPEVFHTFADVAAHWPGDLGRYGDAKIMTPYNETDPQLQREIVVTVGANSKSTHWKPTTMPLGGMIAMLAQHKVGSKDGLSWVLGDMVGGMRNIKAVKSLTAVGLDIDTGMSSEAIDAELKKLGCLAIRYSTHSHMRGTIDVPKDTIARWLEKSRAGVGDMTDDETIRAFLREAKQYDDAVASTAKFGGFEHTKQGIVAKISHDPMPKNRVVLPLAEPFVIADEGTSQKDAEVKWRKIPAALARLLGDIPLDKTGSDPNRLFFLPRHAKGAEFDVALFGGPCLDWKALELDDVWEVLAEELGQGQPKAGTTGPFNARWAARRADGFLIADLIRDHAPDRMRSDGGEKIEIECPFDADHSNAGDPEDRACMAKNGGDTGFVITCRHEGCQERDRLAMLNRMVEDGWFTADDARDDAYDAIEREEAQQDTPIRSRTAVGSNGSADQNYVLPKSFGSFAVTRVDGRKFFAFAGDDEGGGDLAFSRFSLVGGGVYPDRGNMRDLEIAFENESGRCETFRIDADKVANKATAIGMMRRQGIVFAGAKGQAVAHNILMMTQPTNQIIRDRTGWLEDGVFMLPTGVAVGVGDEDVRLSDNVCIKGPPTMGSLDGWIDGAAAAFESGSVSLKVAVLAGLAGPLVALTGQGTLVIMFSGKSSQGKTWRQQSGVSASGPVKPGVGQMQSGNSTTNAMEIPLERGSGTITAYDELHSTSGKAIQNLIFTASGQQGRNRATNTGGQGTVRSWRGGIVTMSGEIGLKQKLQQDGESLAGGATVRVIEIDVNEERLDDESFQRASQMHKNYGHALPVLIKALRDAGYVESPEKLLKRVLAEVVALEVDPTDAMAYRSATGLAYLMVAGEIARNAGLLPASFDFAALAAVVWDSISQGDMRAEDPIDRAIAELLENLNSRIGGEVYDTLESSRDPGGSREIGAVIDKHDGKQVVVLRSKLLGPWSGGFADVRPLTKALLERGIAVPYTRVGRADNPIWDQWRKPIGKSRCLVLRASAVLGDGEDALPPGV